MYGITWVVRNKAGKKNRPASAWRWKSGFRIYDERNTLNTLGRNIWHDMRFGKGILLRNTVSQEMADDLSNIQFDLYIFFRCRPEAGIVRGGNRAIGQSQDVAGILMKSPGPNSTIPSPPSNSSPARPLSSITHSFWFWSYQNPSGDACPLDTIRSILKRSVIKMSWNNSQGMLEGMEEYIFCTSFIGLYPLWGTEWSTKVLESQLL